MPTQVLFVQGAGEAVHDTWDNKLARSLEHELGEGYVVLYPCMPNESEPDYSTWKVALEKAFDTLEDGAILVGHSVGGAILINVLAAQLPKWRPGAILLIAAPFIGEGGWPSDNIPPLVDATRLATDVPVLLYHGTADEIVPFEHLGLYAKQMPKAAVRTLDHRDHQVNDDMSEVARDIELLVTLQWK
jgi:predicted alpha/beta hydrolase family esterase